MKLSDIVGHAGLEFYPQVALVLFLLAFAVAVLRLFLPSQRALHERASRMALDDGAAEPRAVAAISPSTPRQAEG